MRWARIWRIVVSGVARKELFWPLELMVKGFELAKECEGLTERREGRFSAVEKKREASRKARRSAGKSARPNAEKSARSNAGNCMRNSARTSAGVSMRESARNCAPGARPRFVNGEGWGVSESCLGGSAGSAVRKEMPGQTCQLQVDCRRFGQDGGEVGDGSGGY